MCMTLTLMESCEGGEINSKVAVRGSICDHGLSDCYVTELNELSILITLSYVNSETPLSVVFEFITNKSSIYIHG